MTKQEIINKIQDKFIIKYTELTNKQSELENLKKEKASIYHIAIANGAVENKNTEIVELGDMLSDMRELPNVLKKNKSKLFIKKNKLEQLEKNGGSAFALGCMRGDVAYLKATITMLECIPSNIEKKLRHYD